jgi:carbon storage regulator
MLVLTRKLNEKVVINDTITVTVVEIRGDRVRIGISAPLDVAVRREELLARTPPEPGDEDES